MARQAGQTLFNPGESCRLNARPSWPSRIVPSRVRAGLPRRVAFRQANVLLVASKQACLVGSHRVKAGLVWTFLVRSILSLSGLVKAGFASRCASCCTEPSCCRSKQANPVESMLGLAGQVKAGMTGLCLAYYDQPCCD